MRHRNVKKVFGRKAGPRKSLMRGLATNFILHGKIKTTESKAKALRPIVEKHITAARSNSLATRRKLLKYYYDEKAVKSLIDQIGPFYKLRKGGYTRVVKLGVRQGDAAPVAMLELVDYKKKEEKTKPENNKSASKIEKKKAATEKK
ncbi:MAG: 50S ribosomal protein L17 [Patescibacteria group bacterium]